MSDRRKRDQWCSTCRTFTNHRSDDSNHTATSDPATDLVERTRKRMVELSIPAGADTTALVERIADLEAAVRSYQVENSLLQEKMTRIREVLDVG